MKIIGICGSSGSGKSSLSQVFRENNIKVFDCDEIYHKLVDAPSPCLDEIASTFGHDLIQNGRLDRKRLSEIVFSDREKLMRLNEISHRHVIFELDKGIQALKSQNAKACVIDAPMLFEAKLERRCDVVVAVIADEKVQIDRIMQRDGVDAERAKKRLANQVPNEELKRRADYVIENNGSREELRKKCNELLPVILRNEEIK